MGDASTRIPATGIGTVPARIVSAAERAREGAIGCGTTRASGGAVRRFGAGGGGGLLGRASRGASTRSDSASSSNRSAITGGRLAYAFGISIIEDEGAAEARSREGGVLGGAGKVDGAGGGGADDGAGGGSLACALGTGRGGEGRADAIPGFSGITESPEAPACGGSELRDVGRGTGGLLGAVMPFPRATAVPETMPLAYGRGRA